MEWDLDWEMMLGLNRVLWGVLLLVWEFTMEVETKGLDCMLGLG